jgi:hypothetical protein
MEMRVPSEQQRVLEPSRWGRKSALGAPRKKAVRKGFGHKEWIENNRDFTLPRDHPRLQALLERLCADPSKTSMQRSLRGPAEVADLLEGQRLD